MVAFVIRRLLQAIPAIVGVTLVVFLLIHATGDPALIFLGHDATPERIALFNKAYGLDKPLYVQYGLFLFHVIQGDFGTSIIQGRPVIEVILNYLPRTVILALVSTTIGLLVGMTAGIIAGWKRNSIFDYLLMLGSVLGQSAAQFWLGLMLMLVFAVKLGWLPTSGTGSGLVSIKYLILPVLTLTPWFLALTARLVRSGMLEVMRQDYIRTAYAKGLSQWLVITRHAFRNALIPLVTMTGLNLAVLVGGAVIVEILFAWPGIGFLAYMSVLHRDYPVVLGVVTMVAVVFITVNILVDIILAYIDPRIRLTGGKAQ